MPASDLTVETRIGTNRKPRRILSIVSNTTELKGFPVGFFAEEMTRAFLMFTEAGHHVDLASPKGGEVMFAGGEGLAPLRQGLIGAHDIEHFPIALGAQKRLQQMQGRSTLFGGQAAELQAR
ncbi:hypothetical protein CHELA40_30242 [Chelatococcus asaccharovorans]|nr:hypothetical protein [Chelatococcus asaccharovorans]CAH1658638.1 hypothetical protein CHELA17_40174 [Chelatococcus asaccharovorans]CAH1688504.1 hypothetical protein CHELA40_30242 [Chelatococcus asaccharovorans]